ncbi:metallophosphoesterase [Spirosoma fluviale]|uniref:Por secretion system C-terminal sorting domain-containing protein n=1 Tax=Spirosoma fluviale TaxID=1597977 RepID=A0A286GB21_9BACT|nr:metallophosphoesterase [Spirosoma fluviale]SOD92723.1 Por secretion system C-terminal sorting domain-containing protein [Spirosoma fluviale]
MNIRFYLLISVPLFISQPILAQTPKLVRGPYLQVVTPTSVIVRWRTDLPTTGRVWFGKSAESLTETVRETQPVLDHSLTITGLQPVTRYAYAVGFDDTQLTNGPDYYVKTALPTGDTRPVRLWALGDFGNGSENQRNVYQAYQKATANRPADLWLWLGDNAYSFGFDDEYQQFVFSVYPQTLRNTPLFITPGNHDYADSETNFNVPYYKLFAFPEKGEAGGVPSGSKSYYSADYGNVHLVSLDSQGRPDGQFRLYDTTSAQVQWLKRDLAANKLPWTIVIFHHPPYSKGGHNSDTQLSMKLIRENLTPILERYGVDLVLNGHSHGYERTYRIKDLRGLADTFDKTVNIAETTTGRYDGSPNSCPILTKGQGTVYIVNGSGGQVGGQSPGFPHPATVFNNTTLGGSMLLDITDNRLDAQLIMADGSVQDKFTIMKNVNTTTSLTAEYGDTLQLAASWLGDYRWPDGKTSRSIRYVADQSGTIPIAVTDGRQCLTDQFTISVQQQPKLTTNVAGVTALCAGSTIALTAMLEHTTKAAGWQYEVLLSDASGSFIPEQIIGSGALETLKATLPATLLPGTGYKLRIRPRGIPYIQLVASDAFTIKPLPTATLSGSTTLAQGQPVSLTLTFTGDGPWRGSLSDGTPFSGSANPTILTLQPEKTTLYTVASVENSCGIGSTSGEATVTILLPTAEETFAGGQLSVYPNPAHEAVFVQLSTTQKKEVSIVLRDIQGRAVFQKQFGPVMSLSESIQLPAATGTYLLTIQAGESKVIRKIVKQ